MGLLEQIRARYKPRDPTPIQNWLMNLRKKDRLDFDQEEFLVSINNDPCLNRTERQELLGLYAGRFQSLMESLMKLGYIEQKPVKTGKAGRPETLLTLTEQGYKYLESLGKKANRLHGNLEHHCLILKIAQHYQSLGYHVDIDSSYEGLMPDILCRKDYEIGIVEVVNSDNISKDIEKMSHIPEKVNWVIVLCTSKDLEKLYTQKLTSTLPPEMIKKIEILQMD